MEKKSEFFVDEGLVQEGDVIEAVREQEQENEELQAKQGKFAKFDSLLRRLGLKYEKRGIERVPPHLRQKKSVWYNSAMWLSVNFTLNSLTNGMLGQEYYSINFTHSTLIIVFISLLGVACSAFVGTLGPKTGMRTMVLGRYCGGFPVCLVFSIINLLSQLGYAVIAGMVGGQALASVNGNLKIYVGIVIMGVISLVLCFIGYDWLHRWERYAWTVSLIIFCIILGEGSKGHYDISTIWQVSPDTNQVEAVAEPTGKDYVGNCLTFISIVYSVSAAWTSVSADFNVMLPETTSGHKVFWSMFVSEYVPIVFSMMTSNTIFSIRGSKYVDCRSADTSTCRKGTFAFYIMEILSPLGGFGKFLQVVFTFTTISANVPNTYSASLSIQALWRPFERVPRALWTIFVAALWIVGACFGEESFGSVLQDLLGLLSYWTAFFTTIMVWEFAWFRHPKGPLNGLDLTAYNDWSKLPFGIAGILGICAGIGGAVVGMDATYYVGPIASKVGADGGDVGFQMAALMSGIVYPLARYAEIYKWGR